MKHIKRIFIVIVILIIAFFLKGLSGGKIKSIFGNPNNSKNDMMQAVDMGGSTEKSVKTAEDKNGICAEAAIAVDAESGKVLYSKNSDEKMYPASTTKLMTALLMTEYKNKSSILNYSKNAKAQEADHMNFPVGTTMNAENVMEAMLIYSANDMAYMTGENISGSADRFVNLMNKKANALGMESTHFQNPNGLHNPNHYTTASDMSRLARTVYKSNWIMSILEMPSSDIRTKNGRVVKVYNTNKILGQDGCFAGKTGYTSEAGKCLVAYFKKNGRTIIGVVYKSPTDNTLCSDMEKMIDLSCKK